MKNIDRITKYVAKYGTKGTMIHTIPTTGNWVIAQKIEKNNWMMTMCNPMGNVTYNLGTVSDEEHIMLWKEISTMEIENKIKENQTAKELKNKIYQFTKRYAQTYKKFIKTKNKRGPGHKRPKKSVK